MNSSGFCRQARAVLVVISLIQTQGSVPQQLYNHNNTFRVLAYQFRQSIQGHSGWVRRNGSSFQTWWHSIEKKQGESRLFIATQYLLI